jgi:hypothetical protein
MFYSVCVGRKGEEELFKAFYHPENAIECALDFLTKQKNFKVSKYKFADLYKKKKVLIGEFNVDESHQVIIKVL